MVLFSVGVNKMNVVTGPKRRRATSALFKFAGLCDAADTVKNDIGLFGMSLQRTS